jgi:bis(5'-nucleosyl)-tetraphosphatase (symmetrical)
VRKPHRLDTCGEILSAADRDDLLLWLRSQPLARLEHGVLMVHAGVLPQWTAAQTLSLANEVSASIAPERSEQEVTAFFSQMYGNTPDHWRDDWQGMDRLRVVVNALTRLRFCTPQGVMEFESKEGAGGAPEGFMPWFEVPGRATARDVVAFGHWSTLGLVNLPHVMALDTGCVWGGCLSAVRLPGAAGQSREVISVRCEQAQRPG